MHKKQKGQIPLPFLLLGLLVLAAVAAVFLADPGAQPAPGPQPDPTPQVEEEDNPREVIEVAGTEQRTEARTPDPDRVLTDTSGDGRPIGAAIRGSVVDYAGKPVADARIVLTENLFDQNPFGGPAARRPVLYPRSTNRPPSAPGGASRGGRSWLG